MTNSVLSNQGQFYLHFFSPFLRHLKLTSAFSDFFFLLHHHRIPFDPHPITLSSSSLHHCHSTSNSPAIVVSPCTEFPTANLYSGRIHLSSGSVRSAAVCLVAPWCAHSRTCSWRPSVNLSKPFCLTSAFGFFRNDEASLKLFFVSTFI